MNHRNLLDSKTKFVTQNHQNQQKLGKLKWNQQKLKNELELLRNVAKGECLPEGHSTTFLIQYIHINDYKFYKSTLFYNFIIKPSTILN